MGIALSEQTKDSIVEADVDILELLKFAQDMQAARLVKFLKHFVCTNYQPLIRRHGEEGFSALGEELSAYVTENQWPPLSYIAAVEKYERSSRSSGSRFFGLGSIFSRTKLHGAVA